MKKHGFAEMKKRYSSRETHLFYLKFMVNASTLPRNLIKKTRGDSASNYPPFGAHFKGGKMRC